MLASLLCLVCGCLVRIVVYSQTLAKRVEITNPLTSWFRVIECSALSKYGVSPYSGDICHQPPLMIVLMGKISLSFAPYVFIAVDMVTGFILYLTAKDFISLQIKNEEEKKTTYEKDVKDILINKQTASNIPLVVLFIYLFHPYSLVTCSAQSTILFNHLVTSLFLFTLVKNWFVSSAMLVAVSTYLTLYPIVLLVPLLLAAYNHKDSLVCVLKAALGFTISAALLLKLSYEVYSSWDFLNAVYGFTLQVSDLTPNMGLAWYFFLEMFDHFKLFFMWVYQLNVFVYTIPIAIVFRKQPVFMSYILLSLVTLFKSYTNVGDLSLLFAVLPFWWHIYPYTRNMFLVGGILVVTSVLAPCMWYLWIYAGSGNANFFYAVTLAYNSAQVFLLSDVMYASMKRDFHLEHGPKPKLADGTEAKVVMQ